MGFLKDFLSTDDGRKITKLHKESCTYTVRYQYWIDSLFERVMKLFVWDIPEKLPPKEIEMRLILQGHCGVAKYENELTAFFGSFNGVTKYNDEYKNYNVRCPIYSSNKRIGKEVIVINNNSLRNPTFELVHHYATMLAHVEVTIINTLINARDSGGVPIASTQKQKNSIIEYQNKIFNGNYGVVTDIGNLGIEYAGSDRKTQQNLGEMMETRRELLKSFYSDIGVRSAFEKRNNTIQAEVQADTSLLLLNISDMLKCRKEACEEINKLFNTNWSVKVAEEIDYGSENEIAEDNTAIESE